MATIEPPQIRSRARSGTLVDTSGLCSCFMRSCIRHIFKTVTVVCWFSQPCSVCTQFLQKLLLTAATKGLSFELRRPRYCHKAEIVKRSHHAKVADGQNAIQSIGLP